MTEAFAGLLDFGLQTARVVPPNEPHGTGDDDGFAATWIDTDEGPARARLLEAALQHGMPVDGDAVLAMRGRDGHWYVLGRVVRAASAQPTGLRVERRGNDTVLEVPEGNLVLRAAAGVRVEGAEGVALHAARAEVRVHPSGVNVRGDAVRLDADSAELRATTAAVNAERVSTRARHVVTTAGLVETNAQRVIERAQDVYQEVREQLQVKARRVRTVTEEAWTLLGQRIRMRARGDVKIDGEKLYLG